MNLYKKGENRREPRRVRGELQKDQFHCYHWKRGKDRGGKPLGEIDGPAVPPEARPGALPRRASGETSAAFTSRTKSEPNTPAQPRPGHL